MCQNLTHYHLSLKIGGDQMELVLPWMELVLPWMELELPAKLVSNLETTCLAPIAADNQLKVSNYLINFFNFFDLRVNFDTLKQTLLGNVPKR
jgi:hypothetical protein